MAEKVEGARKLDCAAAKDPPVRADTPHCAYPQKLSQELERLQAEVAKLRAPTEECILSKVAQERKGLTFEFQRLQPRRRLLGHYRKINAMRWSRTGNMLCSVAQDGKFIVWDAFRQYKVHVIKPECTWVMTCGYSPSGQHVACGGLDNACTVFKLNQEDTTKTKELNAHGGYLSCCRFNGPNQILTSSGDMTTMLWDLTSAGTVPIRKFSGHTKDVMSISVDEKTNMLVTGSCDATAKVWDIRQKECVMTYRGHTFDINSVEFFPSMTAFGTGSDDGTCRIFEMRCHKELCVFSTPDLLGDEAADEDPVPVTSIAFSNSGRYLFAGYDNQGARVWSVVDPGEQQQILVDKKFEGTVSCIGVEPSKGEAVCTGIRTAAKDKGSPLTIWTG